MKRNNTYGWLLLCCCWLLSACSSTPEQYFDIAVLNSNMFYGFADEGLLRQLESPSVMMVEGSDKPVAMKRSKVIEDKIEYLETSFQKVKALKETDETKEMLQNSRALYEYVMPVYKKEYMELAALYDQAAPPEQIQAYAKTIEDKYFLQYGQLYNKLITSGKSYAQKHNIKVNEVNPSPH